MCKFQPTRHTWFSDPQSFEEKSQSHVPKFVLPTTNSNVHNQSVSNESKMQHFKFKELTQNATFQI